VAGGREEVGLAALHADQRLRADQVCPTREIEHDEGKGARAARNVALAAAEQRRDVGVEAGTRRLGLEERAEPRRADHHALRAEEACGEEVAAAHRTRMALVPERGAGRGGPRRTLANQHLSYLSKSLTAA